jgi:TatD DNase family protein
MSITIKIVNIHTHTPRENTISVCNVFPDDDEIPESAYYSIGIHPWFVVAEFFDPLLRQLESRLQSDDRYLAIGECGLDRRSSTDWPLQIHAFEQQVGLAEQMQKPVIVHAVKTYTDLLKIRKEKKCTMPWIIHGFNGNEQTANELTDAGCYLSLGKLIFQGNSKSAKSIQEFRKDRLFLETDDDENLKIEDVYQRASELLNMEEGALRNQIYLNFNGIFGGQSDE